MPKSSMESRNQKAEKLKKSKTQLLKIKMNFHTKLKMMNFSQGLFFSLLKLGIKGKGPKSPNYFLNEMSRISFFSHIFGILSFSANRFILGLLRFVSNEFGPWKIRNFVVLFPLQRGDFLVPRAKFSESLMNLMIL